MRYGLRLAAMQLKGGLVKLLVVVAFFGVLTLAVLVLLGQLGVFTGHMPQGLGVKDGKLAPPSQTQNSVSSQADLHPQHPQKDYARIEPLHFTGDGDAAMARLADVVRAMPRTVIVQQTPDYFYAQASTQWLRFTDDVEFSLDRSAGVIHVRSASRLGAKDFQVNRRRVEAIRALFNAAQP